MVSCIAGGFFTNCAIREALYKQGSCQLFICLHELLTEVASLIVEHGPGGHQGSPYMFLIIMYFACNFQELNEITQ